MPHILLHLRKKYSRQSYIDHIVRALTQSVPSNSLFVMGLAIFLKGNNMRGIVILFFKIFLILLCLCSFLISVFYMLYDSFTQNISHPGRLLRRADRAGASGRREAGRPDLRSERPRPGAEAERLREGAPDPAQGRSSRRSSG